MNATSTETHATVRSNVSPPVRFWAGLALIATWWPIAWLQVRPLSDNYFFPIWLGFVLAVDGLVFYRTSTSLIHRSGWRFALLFILSAPVWWMFEGFNEVLGNWNYHMPESYGQIEYVVRATIPFSTVIPAVFVTSELVASFRRNPLNRLPSLALTARIMWFLHGTGWLMLLAVLSIPDYAFPLVWISLFFILDPVATFAGGRSIATFLRRNDWSPVWNIAVGTLVCGFFWEMWNYYAMPKWTYSIPFLDVGHIFEMPVLGYGGYIPFGLELFSLYALISTLAPRLKLPAVHVSSRGAN